jgi:membrane protein YqaA with SNARE-associated domain
MNQPGRSGWRRLWWRLAFQISGGMTTVGALPAGRCVVVANAGSAADAPALLAALGTRHRLWFDRAGRIAGMPGLRAGPDRGSDVALVFFQVPGASRDDVVARACQFAATSGLPLVPIGLAGTDRLVDANGGLHPGPVAVRVGQRVAPDPSAVRQAVATLAAPAVPRPDSRVRARVATFTESNLATVAMAAWAAGEAMVLPLLPEFALVVLAVAAPRQALRLAVAATAGSLAGGALMYLLAAHGVALPTPFTTPRMHTVATAQVSVHGAAALGGQPMSGIPYKVYGSAAGRAHVGLGAFLAASAPARGLRIVAAGVLAGWLGAATRRWRRWYTAFLVLYVIFFGAVLSAIVRSWS